MEKKSLNEARKRFQQIVEYVDASGAYNINEVGEDENPQGGQGPAPVPSMGGGAPEGGAPDMGGGDPNMMGGDPSMGGGAPEGGDPNAMGGDPNAEGGAPDMGGDPSMGGGQGAEGFDPQGPDADLGGNSPDAIGGDPNATEDDNEEVIDVDELVDKQEEALSKIDKIEKVYQKNMDAFKEILSALKQDREERKSEMASMRADMEKRNPTPEQKMTLRAQKSVPFSDTVENYWQTEAPSNYSTEDDENGENMPEYQITKDDIDNFTDYASVAKDMDEPRTLKDYWDL